jgi:hypothetical protein
MVDRQIGVGKPVPANSTSGIVTLQMSPDMLPKILDGNLARALLVYAIDLGDLVGMKVFLAMLDDRRGIPADRCAASDMIAYETRFELHRDDLDKMSERRELLNELLHCIWQSQLSFQR